MSRPETCFWPDWQADGLDTAGNALSLLTAAPDAEAITLRLERFWRLSPAKYSRGTHRALPRSVWLTERGETR